VRFTACTAAETGRRFTLSAIPLAVRVGGAVQVDNVALSNPIQTRC
jgi:hypothetical protein